MATPETNLRLTSVLDILAEAHRAGSRPTGQQVIAEALVRVPQTAHEQELLSGGVPRGAKSLTAATAGLVKAGWMTKSRSGWAITADGLRQVQAPEAAPRLSVVPEQAVPEQVVPEAAAGQPSAVALVAGFNVLLGADRDWDPEADQAQMTFDPADGLWKLQADLPAGTYAFKFALDRAWTENYGAFGLRDGANHELRHGGGPIIFAYDHATHDIAADSGVPESRELPVSA
ncbi:glycosidase [Arthrobacter sp. JSM 101049]|uniref:pullulanase X25 domain-containing protein n=1 Tax=Arthrobacter sp. JSM 101049 TaxID=929097 RepID=UPI003564A59B